MVLATREWAEVGKDATARERLAHSAGCIHGLASVVEGHPGCSVVEAIHLQLLICNTVAFFGPSARVTLSKVTP